MRSSEIIAELNSNLIRVSQQPLGTGQFEARQPVESEHPNISTNKKLILTAF